MAAETKFLVTGANGMLGRDLVAALAGRPVTSVDLPELDITDESAVLKAVAGHDVVVNVAAWTAVDDAETKEAAAFTVNAVGPQLLARSCAVNGAKLVQISTDYVFPGDATTPYGEDDAFGPKGAYGRTKGAGEWAVRAELPDAHWIMRTAWLYGEHGPSFVRTMARLEAEKDTLDVVDDQRGQPTWTVDLAAKIIEVVDADIPAGTYHATSSGETTWWGLARATFEHLGADPERVKATTSEKFVRPAPRPAYSVLGHEKWAQVGLEPIRNWEEALREAMIAGVSGRTVH